MAYLNSNDNCSEQCKDLLTVQRINSVCSEESQSNKELIATCFYSCWYSSFLSSARVIYSSYSAGYINEVADMSFTDSLIAFMQKAARDGLYQMASAKSIAFGFFKNKLHETIRNDKSKVLVSEEDVPQQFYSEDVPDKEQKNAMLDCLEKIKPALSEEDITICDMKYKDKLSNSEIAEKLNINTNSFTNRFYRLTGRMQKLINGCLESIQT